jgi:hypothetical protein
MHQLIEEARDEALHNGEFNIEDELDELCAACRCLERACVARDVSSEKSLRASMTARIERILCAWYGGNHRRDYPEEK